MVGLSVRAPVGNCEIVLINLLSEGGDLDSKNLTFSSSNLRSFKVASRRFRVDDGQTGSYQFAGPVSTGKRACVD